MFARPQIRPRYRDDVLEDFVIARNAETGSTLPYLLRVPLGDGIILKAKDTWPRTGKVYCHRVEEWPADAEIIERVAVRSCVRRGAAIDLVLDRGRENRSQIVVTNARVRQMIFWQTARTAKQARPAVTLPGARASGVADLEIVVDIRERYPFTFADRQATTRRAPLSAGDYGLIVDGLLQASVEHKSLADLVSSLTTGKLKFQLTELSAIARAAVVVEERYSQVFKLDHIRPSVVADAIAECQIRFPTVPIVFCDTRKLAQGVDLSVPRRCSRRALRGHGRRLRRMRPRSRAAARARTTNPCRRTSMGDDEQHRRLRPRPHPGGRDGPIPRRPRQRRDLRRTAVGGYPAARTASRARFGRALGHRGWLSGTRSDAGIASRDPPSAGGAVIENAPSVPPRSRAFAPHQQD